MGAGAGKGGGVVQPINNTLANQPGGGLVAQPPASTGTAPIGGNGILPPGSISTSDMGPDGMSTTEREFIAKHGKPFSEMTPQEQFAIQNPQTMRQTLPAQGGFNVNNAAATGLQGAMAGTQQAMAGPLNVGAYMNPYTQEVINRTQNDIERQRQMAINNVGAQAERANAFGGARQALVEGTTNAEYGRMAGDMAAQQRMAGYNTAVANAMADRTGRLGAASQLGSLANQAFNTGRTINQDLMAQGLLQQSLQQALLDSAATDMSNYANAPMNSLSAPLAALGAANMGQQTQNTTQNPGLLGTLGALKYVGLF